MRPEEIAAEFSLPQDAAAEGATAMVLCKVLMENFGVDTVWLPGFSLSDGLAYHYGVKKHYIQKGHNFDEDILAAARTISKRYKCSQSHVKNLESNALQIFDKMKKIHGMDSRGASAFADRGGAAQLWKIYQSGGCLRVCVPYYYGDRDHRIVTF